MRRCSSKMLSKERRVDRLWHLRSPFRYQRYADLKGWKVQRVNENIMEGGGYKECVLQVLQCHSTNRV